MDSFVNIISICNCERERNFESLPHCYNREKLVIYIKPAIQQFIAKDSICGKKVLLKPNWVKHSSNSNDEICLCTHPSFILATIEVLLEWHPKSILIGDAPVQGCDWDKLLSAEFLNEIQRMSEKSGVPITIKDFRKVTFNTEKNVLEENRNSQDDYVIFDVGKKSFLEDITSEKNTFRVTCYNPDKLAETHHKGMHKYCVAKDVFECDTIITLPKIKTHQKAGLTNSLKILVGINGDKDYLPHHRIGAVGHGGDCYKGWHPLRRMSELILDEANRHRGGWQYHPLSYLSAGLWRLSRPKPEQNLAAGWYGNDTVWRMVMDLNLIAKYGKVDGTLSDTPQRTIYTLCDGIVAGQGNGPLSPEPLPLGIIAFSNDPFAMDEVAGMLFRLDMDKIPLLKKACEINKGKNIKYFINGQEVQLSEVSKYSVDVIMPPGWVNYDKQ